MTSTRSYGMMAVFGQLYGGEMGAHMNDQEAMRITQRINERRKKMMDKAVADGVLKYNGVNPQYVDRTLDDAWWAALAPLTDRERSAVKVQVARELTNMKVTT